MSLSRSRSRIAVVAALTVIIGVVTVFQSAAAHTLPPRAPKKWEVKMITENGKQQFDPVDITIQQGDTISWLAVGGSHNVGFWPDSVPKGAVELLRRAMPDTIAPLLGVRKPIKGDTYVVVFTGMPKGVYKYYCKPHLNKMMVGTVTIK